MPKVFRIPIANFCHALAILFNSSLLLAARQRYLPAPAGGGGEA